MNCDSCEEPKNSLMAATIGRMFTRRLRGDLVGLLHAHALAHHALHARQADAELVLDELADRADAAVAEVVDVVDLDALFTGMQAR